MKFTSDHPHAKLLQRIYRRDPDDFMGLLEEVFEESFVCHGAGDGPVGGEFVGLEAMLAHLADLERLSAGTLTATPLEFHADDTWAMVPQIMTASRHGRSLELAVAGFWRFSRPGRLAEHWEIVSDTPAWDAFWSA